MTSMFVNRYLRYTVPQLKPKLDNAETKKSFHEFSFINKAGAALVRTITSLLLSATAPLRIMAHVSDDNCHKPQNVPGCNHDQPLSR